MLTVAHMRPREFESNGAVKVATFAFESLAYRVAEHEPDCEYLGALEFAYGNVLLLEGLGILTADFARRFAEAVDANRAVAWTMTSEARQTKLDLNIAQRVYRISPEDRPASYPRSPKTSSRRVDPEDMKMEDVVDLDGPWTPSTTVVDTTADADEAAVPAYDTGPGLYDGLTALGHWVTENDEGDDLLSKDRFQSFARFITGTTANQALLATGSVLVIIGSDFLPAPVRGVALAAGGIVLRRSARIATHGTRQHVADAGTLGAAAGLVQIASALPTIDGFVTALRAALTEPAGLFGVGHRLAENLASWVGTNFLGTTSEQAIHATRLWLARYLSVRGVREILDWPLLTQAILGLAASRQVLAVGTVASTLYYYFGYHHANRYVPSRQRYYLAINSAKVFADKEKLLRKRIKDVGKKIALYPARWPPAAGAGAPPAPVNPAILRDKALSVGITNRLTNIVVARQTLAAQNPTVPAAEAWVRGGPAPGQGGNPNQCPRIPRGQGVQAGDLDLEKKCCDVDDLVTRILAVEVEIDNLQAQADQELANFGIQIASSIDTWSVVDEVFAKLHL